MFLPTRRLDPELLRQHGHEDLHLHVTEAGQLLDAHREIVAIARTRPHRRRVAAVLLDDRLAQGLDALSHAAGEAVKSRTLAKYGNELVGVRSGDLARVEMAEALLQLIRAGERLLHLDLLVQDQSDEQRERICLEQPVGFGIFRPDDGHLCIIPLELRSRGWV